MRGKRTPLVGLVALLVVLAGLTLFGSARADIHAVVVGVNAYRHLTPLEGAVNDAKDVADAVEKLGGAVTLLLNDDATRARVKAALERKIAAAGPSDLFVFAYAGHGVQEPEATPGEEADGKDETLAFGGFDWDGAAAGERLRDNEIGALLDRLDPGARALVVIDSCHSGTMTRAAHPLGRRFKTRFGGIGRISKDPLPPADRAGGDRASAGNVIFAAASAEDEQTPEVTIDSRPRGALSWSVARMLRGAGTSLPLKAFAAKVRAEARALSGARQTPVVTLGRSIDPEAPLMRGASVSAAPILADPMRRVRVHAVGGAPDAPPGPDALWAPARENADLVWDPKSGAVVAWDQSDLFAEAPAASDLPAAILAWQAASALRSWPGARALGLYIRPGDGRHRLGEEAHLSVDRPETMAYVTLINLASTGATQFVFPSAADRAASLDRVAPGSGLAPLGSAPVTMPPGADHLIAIFSERPPEALHDWLRTARPDSLAVVERLRRDAGPAGWRVGFTPVFTVR